MPRPRLVCRDWARDLCIGEYALARLDGDHGPAALGVRTGKGEGRAKHGHRYCAGGGAIAPASRCPRWSRRLKRASDLVSGMHAAENAATQLGRPRVSVAA